MSERRVTFGIVDPDQGREAYQWHRGFTGANQNVYARPWSDYEKLAERGQIMCAVDDNGDYLGLCYFMFEKKKKAWELGGMMVAAQQRGRGIGNVLGRVVIGHILFEEDPLSRNERVIARVVEQNSDPRQIIEGEPGAFKKHAGAFRATTDELPGVVTKGGEVVGDEFVLEPAVAALLMSEWCRTWSGVLKDGTPAHVRMRPGVTLDVWSRAFADMASSSST